MNPLNWFSNSTMSRCDSKSAESGLFMLEGSWQTSLANTLFLLGLSLFDWNDIHFYFYVGSIVGTSFFDTFVISVSANWAGTRLLSLPWIWTLVAVLGLSKRAAFVWWVCSRLDSPSSLLFPPRLSPIPCKYQHLLAGLTCIYDRHREGATGGTAPL